MLVIMHNDPDPDAIASAVGLGYMLEKAEGIDVHIAYRGVIGRAENRALSKYIGAHFIKCNCIKIVEMRFDFPECFFKEVM